MTLNFWPCNWWYRWCILYILRSYFVKQGFFSLSLKNLFPKIFFFQKSFLPSDKTYLKVSFHEKTPDNGQNVTYCVFYFVGQLWANTSSCNLIKLSTLLLQMGIKCHHILLSWTVSCEYWCYHTWFCLPPGLGWSQLGTIVVLSNMILHYVHLEGLSELAYILV